MAKKKKDGLLSRFFGRLQGAKGEEEKSPEAAYAEALRRIRESAEPSLDLSDLGLTEVPPEIRELSHLEHLYVFANRLVTLPLEIGQLTKLRSLNAGRNSLENLALEFERLTELRELSIWGNRFEQIPQFIFSLTGLKRLDLSWNQIRALPADIGRLRNLRRLDLARNALEALPSELRTLDHLEELFLQENPSLDIPKSILGGSFVDGGDRARPRDILDFYFARQEGAAAGTLQALNEIKVMLVGDGGAGKTSLRRFFMGEPHSDQEKETLGIALDTFELAGESPITVRLWDFAGQEITHALHQFFLTEGCAYIVVVEPRSDNEQRDAEKWLKLIQRYGRGAPAIVVLNKQDTRSGGYDVDRNLLRERYPFIRAFQPTSCGKTRNGCDELLETLRGVVSSMSEATLEVSRSWIAVKDACFSQGKDGAARQYLTLDEFRALCEQEGETDRAKQDSLARILHNLGAVLHFADEPRLRDTTVLNPHWVTDGAYRLLRKKEGVQSNGLMTIQEAIQAVPGADEAAVRYLLQLMERFEMCFAADSFADVDTVTNTWLIPGSLDRNQPDGIHAADWQAADRTRLRYSYDPLPQGVIPRLIVMTHTMSQGQPRWRNGVVLAQGEAKALVRRAGGDNTIEVTVQGPGPACENLVKIVRGYLARIHQDVPEPKPIERQELAGLPDTFRETRQLKAYERQGVPIVVETHEGDVVKNPTEELNRLSGEAPRTSKKRPLRLFLSYSHDDRKKQERFRKNLMALENDGYITFWDDPNIKAGMEWRPEIDRELEKMDVFVGLLTTNFVTSGFIRRVEFKRALERRKGADVRLWLILVDPRRIAGTKFEDIQVLKPGGKAVSQYKSLQAGFDAVEEELHRLVIGFWSSRPDATSVGAAGRD